MYQLDYFCLISYYDLSYLLIETDVANMTVFFHDLWKVIVIFLGASYVLVHLYNLENCSDFDDDHLILSAPTVPLSLANNPVATALILAQVLC